MLSASRLRLLIGAVSALVLAGLAVAVIAANAVERTERSSRALRGPVERVVVDSEAGDLSLRTSADPDVTVRETRRFSSREPKVAVDLRDGVLRITVDCGGFFTLHCADDLELTVPRTVTATAIELDSGDADVTGLDGDRFTVESDSGDITARQVTGTLSLATDSGDVVAEDVAGPLALDTDSGDAVARRVRADRVTASTDSGDVQLALDTAPNDVEAESDSGDVVVAVPRGRYNVAAETDSGEVSIDGVLPDDAAGRRVAARTDSGDVSVLGR
jgi:putative adhesin